MPPLPSIAKVLKVAFTWTDGVNTDIVTRFYISYSGSAPSPADLNNFCDDAAGIYNTDLKADCAIPNVLIRVDAIDLSSPTSAEGFAVTSIAGTATGAPNPIDTALVVSYEIARRYRGGHPRGYWPLLTADQLLNPQRWTDAAIAGMTTDLGNFFTGVLGLGWSGAGTLSQVNVSYFHGFTVVTSPTTGRARNVPTVRATPIVDGVTAFIPRLRVGTQRRRLQYG
jgi:hypothetical protein